MEKIRYIYIKVIISIYSLGAIFFPSFIYARDLNSQPSKFVNFQEFSTKNHPKAKGLDIRIKYPKDWIAKEGDRPHIVQKFSKEIEKGISIVCAVGIKEFPPQLISLSDKEIAQEIFSEEGIKSILYPEGVKILKYINTKYDGQPGILIYSTTINERAGMKGLMYILDHSFIYSKKLISIVFFVGGVISETSDISKIEKYFKTYEPIFLQIGNGVVIYNKWKGSHEE